MFHIVEKYRLPAQIMLGAIAVSFVAFGFAGFQSLPNDSYIVKIGDQTITRADLDRAVDNTEASGGQADRATVFQTLTERAYLLAGAKKLGIAVSDDQIKQMIVDAPAFHDAAGKFDIKLFQAFLANAHMTEQQFMDEQRRSMMVFSLLQTLNANVATDSQTAQLATALFATRSVRIAVIDPQAFAAKVAANDAELQKFYKANPKKYTLPQGVKFEYLVFSPDNLADRQTVSDEEIRKAFENEKSSLKPKRRIAHILIKVPQNADANARAEAKAQAEKIAAEAKAKPEQFAELAKKYSQDAGSAAQGGELGEFAQDGKLGSHELENAAFALKKGEISGVVESQFGYHIVRVSDIGTVDLESQKNVLRRKLQEKKAQQAFAALRESVSKAAFDSPSSLKAAAEKAGLPVGSQNEWMTRANATQFHVPQAVVDALFSNEVFNKRHNSDGINANGALWFVRVTDARKETLQPFNQVKAQVGSDYVRSESLRLAKEYAKQMIADLKAGKTAPLAWTPAQDLTPDEVRSKMPETAYAALMGAIPKNGKPAYALLDMPDAPEVAEVSAVKLVSNPQQLEMARGLVRQNAGEALLEAYIDTLRTQIPTKQGSEKLSEE